MPTDGGFFIIFLLFIYMKKRPSYVHEGDFVQVDKTEIFGYVVGLDYDMEEDRYYIELDLGVNKKPLYLYDDQVSVLNIISE